MLTGQFSSESEVRLTWLASSKGYIKIVELLLPRDIQDAKAWCSDAMYEASITGHINVVEFCIVRGADVNLVIQTATWAYRTPLQTASAYGHIDIVRLLIDHGAEAEAIDPDGNIIRALDWAQDHVEIVKLLTDHAATKAEEAEVGVPEGKITVVDSA